MSEKLPPSKTSKRQSSRSDPSSTSSSPEKVKRNSEDILLLSLESQPGPSRQKFPEVEHKVCEETEIVEAVQSTENTDQVIKVRETTSKGTITDQELNWMLENNITFDDLVFERKRSVASASFSTEIDPVFDEKLREISQEVQPEPLEERLQRFLRENPQFPKRSIKNKRQKPFRGFPTSVVLHETLRWKLQQPFLEMLQRTREEIPQQPLPKSSEQSSQEGSQQPLREYPKQSLEDRLQQEGPQQPIREHSQKSLEDRLQQIFLEEPQQLIREHLQQSLQDRLQRLCLEESQQSSQERTQQSLEDSLQQLFRERSQQSLQDRPQQPFSERSKQSLNEMPGQEMPRHQPSSQQPSPQEPYDQKSDNF